MKDFYKLSISKLKLLFYNRHFNTKTVGCKKSTFVVAKSLTAKKAEHTSGCCCCCDNSETYQRH